MRKLLLLLLIPLNAVCQSKTDFSAPPAWAASAIWYEIFVERFCNGDPANDPTLEDITVPGQSEPPREWKVTPWTSDWYSIDKWARPGTSFTDNIFFRRYGGDLQGVLQKLDYLEELGVNALYFRPLNDAPSLHKYDARSYHHIDIHFGPDPEGDKKIIASEDPKNPATWKWTSADKLFLKVIEEAHKRNMKVVLDYSWNHTGILFWAFREIVARGRDATTKDWYMIDAFDDLSTKENEMKYRGWLGIESLPEIKKVDVITTRVTGYPYEGDIHPDVKKHIYDVTKRWLAPDGDVSKGVDGYRLDVADQVGLKFWREFRKVVRSIDSDAYLVGEIWWQRWPEQLMDPRPYTNGDIFDAVMFYQVYRPARYFFAETDFSIDAKQFRDSLEFQWGRLSEKTKYAMMNTSSSGDAPRLLSDFYNSNKYKVSAKPVDDPGYKTGKPDEESYKRLRLYLVHAFTNIGAPSIYYGEEAGMWGADDPDNRKPMWWPELEFSDEKRNNFQKGVTSFDKVGFDRELFNFYKKLVAIRKANPVLSYGKFTSELTDGRKLSYRRHDASAEILVVFNVEETQNRFSLREKTKYVDLLTGKEVSGSITLDGLSAAILKKS